jgi:hypothetical protein
MVSRNFLISSCQTKDFDFSWLQLRFSVLYSHLKGCNKQELFVPTIRESVRYLKAATRNPQVFVDMLMGLSHVNTWEPDVNTWESDVIKPVIGVFLKAMFSSEDNFNSISAQEYITKFCKCSPRFGFYAKEWLLEASRLSSVAGAAGTGNGSNVGGRLSADVARAVATNGFVAMHTAATAAAGGGGGAGGCAGAGAGAGMGSGATRFSPGRR